MKISSYILLSSLLALLPLTATSQDKVKNDTVSGRLLDFRGLSVSTDLFGYAYSLLEDYTSGEVALEINLGNKYYPVVEVGYGSTDFTDETFGIYYKSAAPYYKIGLNYNFSNKIGKKPRHSYIYGLARFAWTRADYDVSAPPITDPVWGGSVGLDLNDVSGYYSWIELGVGVKVKILKNFHMGWSVRYKARANQVTGSNSRMWYIPGFGNSRHTTFGGTYSLIYEIPFK